MSKDRDYTVEDVLKSLISDGAKGKVCLESETLGDWYFYVRFFADIEGENNIKNSNCPVIKIPNYKQFKQTISDYLKHARPFYDYDREYDELDFFSYDKYLIFTLLVNAQASDFENIVSYVNDRTQMLKNRQNCGIFELGNISGYKLCFCIQKAMGNLEAPYKFTSWFVDEGNYRYILPTIYFGEADDYVYIGAVQGEKNKQDNIFARKIDRFIRKVNKGVNMEEIEGNVSPSAVVSMTIFNAYLKSKEIKNIKSPTFTPIRYYAMKNQNYAHAEMFNKPIEQAKIAIEKRDRIQHNVTEKLAYLYYRYLTHFDDCVGGYDQDSGELKLLLSDQNKTGDNLIYEVDKVATAAFNKEYCKIK